MKKLVKGVFVILIACIILAAGLYFYARYVEPARLVVRQVEVESDKLSDDLRLAVLADTHVGNGGMDSRRLEKIMAAVAEQAPDAVAFLGDLFDNYGTYSAQIAPQEAEALATALAPEALAGVPRFAVYGNHDLGGRAGGAFRQVLEQAGWRILVNEAAALGGLNLIGSDDVIFGRPDVEGLIDPAAFNLLLVHEPDIANMVTGIDLQLSGHTHGGQVRLPFFGALVLPQWGREYVRGLYDKPDGGKVFVTTGLGMSTLPFRLGAVPEIAVVTLRGTAR